MPEGNGSLYPYDDVDNVNEMWWHILLTKLDAKLCVNQSQPSRNFVSSSTSNVSNAYNKLHRVKGQEYINLDGTKETATEDIKPDIILIFLGHLDYVNNSTLGEVSYTVGTEMTTDFCQGVNGLLYNLFTNIYPNAQIYLLDGIALGDKGFFAKNSSGKYYGEYIKAIRELGEMRGVHILHPSRICLFSLNEDNTDLVTNDDNLKAKAMKLIANQCYHEMLADNCLE